MLLHNGRALLVQHGGQYARRKVQDRHFAAQVADALGALHADQARAHDQHAAVGLKRRHQRPGVVQRHEAELVLHRFQPLHRGHERRGARRDQQLVVRNLFAVCKRHGPGLPVDGHRRAAQQRRDAVLLVEIVGAVFHVRLVRLAPGKVGDQRPGVGVVRLGGNQRDAALLVHRADALHAAHRRRGVADDDVFHMLTSPHTRWRGWDSPPRTRARRRRSSCTARTSARGLPRSA